MAFTVELVKKGIKFRDRLGHCNGIISPYEDITLQSFAPKKALDVPWVCARAFSVQEAL